MGSDRISDLNWLVDNVVEPERRTVRDSYAPGTWKAHCSAWRLFVACCRSRNSDPLAATSSDVITTMETYASRPEVTRPKNGVNLVRRTVEIVYQDLFDRISPSTQGNLHLIRRGIIRRHTTADKHVIDIPDLQLAVSTLLSLHDRFHPTGASKGEADLRMAALATLYIELPSRPQFASMLRFRHVAVCDGRGLQPTPILDVITADNFNLDEFHRTVWSVRFTIAGEKSDKSRDGRPRSVLHLPQGDISAPLSLLAYLVRGVGLRRLLQLSSDDYLFRALDGKRTFKGNGHLTPNSVSRILRDFSRLCGQPCAGRAWRPAALTLRVASGQSMAHASFAGGWTSDTAERIYLRDSAPDPAIALAVKSGGRDSTTDAPNSEVMDALLGMDDCSVETIEAGEI